MTFARGVRRLFTTLAIAWAVIAGLTFLFTDKGPDQVGDFMNILIEVVGLYGFGWFVTFLVAGFRRGY